VKRSFANDWLRDVTKAARESSLSSLGPGLSESAMPLLQRLFSLRAQDFDRIVRPIQDFHGTKLMVSCTDRTPLKNVLKQALCLADLVIIVPAPLWVSCVRPESVRYAEFNFEALELAGGWNVAPGLLRNLWAVLLEEHQAVDDGAVTFLPQVGETLQRWSHRDLALPELRLPYLGNQSEYASAHIKAFYSLCSERLTAERLGAMYLNSVSFTLLVLGDLTIGKRTQNREWVRSLIEISIPELSALSLGDILRLRRKLPDVCSQLSRVIDKVVRPQDQDNKAMERAIVDLRMQVAGLTRQMKSVLARDFPRNKKYRAQTALVLGSGGPNGGTISTVDFLLEGGTLGDLLQLITQAEKSRLEVRQDSIFATTPIEHAAHHS